MTAEKDDIVRRILDKSAGYIETDAHELGIERIIRAELAPLLRAVDAVLESNTFSGEATQECLDALRDARGGA